MNLYYLVKPLDQISVWFQMILKCYYSESVSPERSGIDTFVVVKEAQLARLNSEEDTIQLCHCHRGWTLFKCCAISLSQETAIFDKSQMCVKILFKIYYCTAAEMQPYSTDIRKHLCLVQTLVEITSWWKNYNYNPLK